MSQATTCGKCHSDYPVMQQGWHFNFARSDAPHGRPGEPWILTDVQTRTQLPLSYRRWPATFHPHDVGINDFQFARLFGRHHPGGGALQESSDLRFKMSGPLENDCLICHTSDRSLRSRRPRERDRNRPEFQVRPDARRVSSARCRDRRLVSATTSTPPGLTRGVRRRSRTTRRASTTWATSSSTSERRVSNERCYFCHTNIDDRPRDKRRKDGNVDCNRAGGTIAISTCQRDAVRRLPPQRRRSHDGARL
jgi:hypothetical protein